MDFFPLAVVRPTLTQSAADKAISFLQIAILVLGLLRNIAPNLDSPPAVLLRESYREGTKVCKRTLANLSALSAAQVQMIRSMGEDTLATYTENLLEEYFFNGVLSS